MEMGKNYKKEENQPGKSSPRPISRDFSQQHYMLTRGQDKDNRKEPIGFYI